MKRNKENIIQQMVATRIIPIFNHDDIVASRQMIERCYKSGLRVVEFTNRSESALSVFAELLSYVEKEFSEMSLGAGTILNREQADAFIQAGAHFIVSPSLNAEVGAACNEKQVLWIPGCFTPTEIMQAYALGAEVVKLFPASVLTPGFLKSIKAPMPFVKAIVTGGIRVDNVQTWIDAGAIAVGLGNSLFVNDGAKIGE